MKLKKKNILICLLILIVLIGGIILFLNLRNNKSNKTTKKKSEPSIIENGDPVSIKEYYYEDHKVNLDEEYVVSSTLILLDNGNYYYAHDGEARWGTLGKYKYSDNMLILYSAYSFGSGCGFNKEDGEQIFEVVDSNSISSLDDDGLILTKNDSFEGKNLVHKGECTESKKDAEKLYNMGYVVQYDDKIYDGSQKVIREK